MDEQRAASKTHMEETVLLNLEKGTGHLEGTQEHCQVCREEMRKAKIHLFFLASLGPPAGLCPLLASGEN